MAWSNRRFVPRHAHNVERQRRERAADMRRVLRGHPFACDCETCSRERDDAARQFTHRAKQEAKP